MQTFESRHDVIHRQVLQYMRNKTADYDRWIAGMAKLQRNLAQGKK